MNIKYKEEPRAWRKSTWFTLLPLLVVSAILRWRGILSSGACTAAMGVLVCIGFLAWARPHWFRLYYRFSTWAGFWSSQCVSRVVLAVIFAIVLIPAGLLTRLLGKDPLHLKRSRNTTTYWSPARKSSPLDRLF